MYENRHGRFTAVDPLLASGKSANPQSFNRYVYVGNDPINITDPLGLDWYSRKDPNNEKRTQYEWFDKAPGTGGWNAVDFGGFAQLYFRIPNADKNGSPLGAIYLNRYGNSYLNQTEFNQLNQKPYGCFGSTNVCAITPSFYGDVLGGQARGAYNFGVNVINGITELPAYGAGMPLIFKPEDFHFLKRWDYDNGVQAREGFRSELVFSIGLIAASGPRTTSNPFRFSQTSASVKFSKDGDFAGQTIGSVASELRSGALNTNAVPVEFVTRNGVNLIVNTRSSLALRRAGIPSSRWNTIDKTGNAFTESTINKRLIKNELNNGGTDSLYITGGGRFMSILD